MADLIFVLPDLGEGLVDATVLEWYVSEGEHIERGDPIAEVETTKSAIELPSPHSGVVTRLHARVGESVDVGSPLITFESADDQAGIVGTVPAEATPTRTVRLSLPEDE